MQEANILFTIHFICYWSMVMLYDIDSLIHFADSVKYSLKNQIFSTWPLCHLLFYYYPIQSNNFFISLLAIFPVIIAGDLYFYISHRPLHSQLLWKFHKTHHRGNVCVSKSLDADIIEHIFGNVGSFICGFILMQYFGFIYNIYVIYLWGAIATINTCISHSNNKCYYDNGIHYIHHKHLKCNYGTGLYIMDKLCGSYKLFQHRSKGLNNKHITTPAPTP